MMIRKLIKISLILLLVPSFSVAQKKLLSIEDATLGARTNLAIENLQSLKWRPETNHFSYLQKDGPDLMLVIESIQNDFAKEFLRTEDLVIAFNAYAIQIASPKYSGLIKKFPSNYSWVSKNKLRFNNGQYLFTYDLIEKSIYIEYEFLKEATNYEFHEESVSYAYIINNEIWVKKNGEEPIKISQVEKPGITYGTSVHRNEFGINKGLFWSNSGRFLAYYVMDESMVTDYPIYNLDNKPASSNMIKYPFAGAKSHHVIVRIYDSKTKKTVDVQSGYASEQYLTNLTFTPNDENLYIAIVNRGQNNMTLKSFFTETGKPDRTLFSETSEKYVEPEHGPLFLDKGKKFIWQSERSGANHLYLYNNKGELLKQLSSGTWMVTDLIGVDPKENFVYFKANKENGIRQNIYQLNLKNSAIQLISSSTGQHFVSFNQNFDLFIDNWSDMENPRIIEIRDVKGKQIKQLLKAKNPLDGFDLPQVSVFTIKSEDQKTDLYCRQILPPNFDKTKKYPVLVYLYGGPHLQLIQDRFMGGADYWLIYMAQQGYVVFSLDNRGSANRNFEFESVIHRQLGNAEMNDQLKGVEYLKTQTFVDSSRIGVYGWSFGGFLTTTLMTRAPGTFKVGVAGGPVIDWSMYEIMYTERYMDTPEENPDGYQKNNLLNYVENLRGKLLMIHGTSDDVVLWQHSLAYVKKAVEKGVLLDYFVYPEHFHNVSGRDRIHLMRKITQYFRENL